MSQVFHFTQFDHNGIHVNLSRSKNTFKFPYVEMYGSRTRISTGIINDFSVIFRDFSMTPMGQIWPFCKPVAVGHVFNSHCSKLKPHGEETSALWTAATEKFI